MKVIGPRHVYELITLHTLLNNLPQNLPNDLQSFLFCVNILCTAHMQWNQCPVTHPFTAKGIHVHPRKERGGGGGYTGKIKTLGWQRLFGIIYTISVNRLNTCSRPWRVDFSTILNSFSRNFTVSSGTPFVKQNSKRSEE